MRRGGGDALMMKMHTADKDISDKNKKAQHNA